MKKSVSSSAARSGEVEFEDSDGASSPRSGALERSIVDRFNILFVKESSLAKPPDIVPSQTVYQTTEPLQCVTEILIPSVGLLGGEVCKRCGVAEEPSSMPGG